MSESKEASLRNECPRQMVCKDCSLDESGKVCIHFEDDECWEQAWEDEQDDFDGGDE